MYNNINNEFNVILINLIYIYIYIYIYKESKQKEKKKWKIIWMKWMLEKQH